MSHSIGCFSQGPCPGGALEPAPGDLLCTAQCSDATGPVCSYECTGSTAADLDKSCAAAKAAACAGTDADLQKACDDAEGKCKAPIAVADVAAFCNVQKPASACTATVGEFEACADEYFAVVEESLSGFTSCSDLTVADLIRRGVGPATPVLGKHTACTTFSDKCPGAFAPDGS